MSTADSDSPTPDNVALTALRIAIEFAEQRFETWRLSNHLPPEVATDCLAESRQLRIRTLVQVGTSMPQIVG